MEDPFADSDEEDYRLHHATRGDYKGKSFGGLCPLPTEGDDFGEEFSTYAASLRRVNRRFARWAAQGKQGVVQPAKKHYEHDHAPVGKHDARGVEQHTVVSNGKVRLNGGSSKDSGDVAMEDADDLDDMDKELLGLASGAEDEEEDPEEDEEGDGFDESQMQPDYGAANADDDEDSDATV